MDIRDRLEAIENESCIIDASGSKCWYNKEGQLHRDDDEPAKIDSDGTMCWYQNGVLHRDNDKPAMINPNGYKAWVKNGLTHRDNDDPAIIRPDGIREWYQYGELHRNNDRPSITSPDGSKVWYKYGKKHRENGKPACIFISKYTGKKEVEYWENGEQYYSSLMLSNFIEALKLATNDKDIENIELLVNGFPSLVKMQVLPNNKINLSITKISE